MTPARHLVTLAVLAAGLAAAPASGRSAQDAPAATCTNPYSGASWTIRIDYAHATVDAIPARIGESEISWHDARDNGNYTLDRKSGALTAILPSSTGGYFIHAHCRLPP